MRFKISSDIVSAVSYTHLGKDRETSEIRYDYFNLDDSQIFRDHEPLIAPAPHCGDHEHFYYKEKKPVSYTHLDVYKRQANMLAAYYSKGCNSEEMFSGLDISRESDFRTHLNKHDVIHLDIQWFLANCDEVDNVVAFITKSVQDELREIYPGVLPEEEISLSECLSRIKNDVGQKFIVIIDEWDVLIRDEAANKKVQEKYINFLRAMFKGTEPTKYIQLAYLTGILPIKKEKTQSALNNFDEFTMLDAGVMAPYIGFTEDEVKDLCEKYHRDFEKVKYWYDGYLLEDYQVYNPKAVVSVCVRGRFRSYWSETASYEAIVPFINMNYDGLKNAIIEILSGASIKVNTAAFKNDTVNIQSKDDVLTYLIHLGYLGYNQNRRTAFVPNEEIRQELTTAVESRKWNEMITFQQESEHLLEATLDMDEEAVEEMCIRDRLYTEIEVLMETKLARISQLSKENPDMVFTSLGHQMCIRDRS